MDWTSGFDVPSMDGFGDWGIDNPGGTFSAPTYGMIDNGDGTFTDPASGIIYDANGTSTGQTDPMYENAGGLQPENTAGGGGAGASGGGSSGSGGSSLLRQLGLTTSGGDPNLLGWASILGPLLGGALAYHTTGTAANQVQAGLSNASDAIKQLLGGGSAFAPYQAAGSAALGKLGSMGFTPLGPQFGPLGGRPIPGMAAPTSLAALMKKGK